MCDFDSYEGVGIGYDVLDYFELGVTDPGDKKMSGIRKTVYEEVYVTYGEEKIAKVRKRKPNSKILEKIKERGYSNASSVQIQRSNIQNSCKKVFGDINSEAVPTSRFNIRRALNLSKSSLRKNKLPTALPKRQMQLTFPMIDTVGNDRSNPSLRCNQVTELTNEPEVNNPETGCFSIRFGSSSQIKPKMMTISDCIEDVNSLDEYWEISVFENLDNWHKIQVIIILCFDFFFTLALLMCHQNVYFSK